MVPKHENFTVIMQCIQKNEKPLYGVDPNLPDVDPEYGDFYPNNIEGSIKYLDPRSTRGGRRRKMKQTKRTR